MYSIKGNALEELRLNLPKGVNFSDMVMDSQGLLYLSSNQGLWILDQQLQGKQVSLAGTTEKDLAVVYFDRQHNFLTASCSKVFFVDKNTVAQARVNGTLRVSKEYNISSSCIKGIVEKATSPTIGSIAAPTC